MSNAPSTIPFALEVVTTALRRGHVRSCGDVRDVESGRFGSGNRQRRRLLDASIVLGSVTADRPRGQAR